MPIQPGRKRSRVSELKLTNEPIAGSLASERNKRRNTSKSVLVKKLDIKKSDLKQREHRPTPLTTKSTKPTNFNPTSKNTPTHSRGLQSALCTQSQTLSVGDDVEGARYESDEDGDRQVTPTQTGSETADSNDVIDVSSASSSEEDMEDGGGQ